MKRIIFIALFMVLLNVSYGAEAHWGWDLNFNVACKGNDFNGDAPENPSCKDEHNYDVTNGFGADYVIMMRESTFINLLKREANNVIKDKLREGAISEQVEVEGVKTTIYLGDVQIRINEIKIEHLENDNIFFKVSCLVSFYDYYVNDAENYFVNNNPKKNTVNISIGLITKIALNGSQMYLSISYDDKSLQINSCKPSDGTICSKIENDDVKGKIEQYLVNLINFKTSLGYDKIAGNLSEEEFGGYRYLWAKIFRTGGGNIGIAVEYDIPGLSENDGFLERNNDKDDFVNHKQWRFEYESINEEEIKILIDYKSIFSKIITSQLIYQDCCTSTYYPQKFNDKNGIKILNRGGDASVLKFFWGGDKIYIDGDGEWNCNYEFKLKIDLKDNKVDLENAVFKNDACQYLTLPVYLLAKISPVGAFVIYLLNANDFLNSILWDIVMSVAGNKIDMGQNFSFTFNDITKKCSISEDRWICAEFNNINYDLRGAILSIKLSDELVPSLDKLDECKTVMDPNDCKDALDGYFVYYRVVEKKVGEEGCSKKGDPGCIEILYNDFIPDNDNILTRYDNCPGVYNPDQKNMDNDRDGDLCDLCVYKNPYSIKEGHRDWDHDMRGDECDNCTDSRATNPLQTNIDGDRQGDICDVDKDGDGFSDIKNGISDYYNPIRQELVDPDDFNATLTFDLDYDGYADFYSKKGYYVKKNNEVNYYYIDPGDKVDKESCKLECTRVYNELIAGIKRINKMIEPIEMLVKDHPDQIEFYKFTYLCDDSLYELLGGNPYKGKKLKKESADEHPLIGEMYSPWFFNAYCGETLLGRYLKYEEKGFKNISQVCEYECGDKRMDKCSSNDFEGSGVAFTNYCLEGGYRSKCKSWFYNPGLSQADNNNNGISDICEGDNRGEIDYVFFEQRPKLKEYTEYNNIGVSKYLKDEVNLYFDGYTGKKFMYCPDRNDMSKCVPFDFNNPLHTGSPWYFALVNTGEFDVSLGVCRCIFSDGIFREDKCRQYQCPLVDTVGKLMDYIDDSRFRYYNPITNRGKWSGNYQTDSYAFCYSLKDAEYKLPTGWITTPFGKLFYDYSQYCSSKIFPSKKIVFDSLLSSTIVRFSADWYYRNYAFPKLWESGYVIQSNVGFEERGLIEIDNTGKNVSDIYVNFGLAYDKNPDDGTYKKRKVSGDWIPLKYEEIYKTHIQIPIKVDLSKMASVDTITDRVVPPLRDIEIVKKLDRKGMLNNNALFIDPPNECTVCKTKWISLYNPEKSEVKDIYSIENGNMVLTNGIGIPARLRYYAVYNNVSSLRKLGISDDDREREVVFVYGGVDGENRVRNDLYVVWFSDDISVANVYKYQSPNISQEEFPKVRDAVVVYNKERNNLYILDGFGYGDVFKKDAYVLDFDNGMLIKRGVENAMGSWSWLDIEWISDLVFVYDEKRDMLYGFGGRSDRGMMDGVMAINLGSMLAVYRWGEMSKGMGARGGMGSYYDKETNRVYFIGGYDLYGGSVRYHNDIWGYDIDTGRWQQIVQDTTTIPKVVSGVLSLNVNRDGFTYYGGMCPEVDCSEKREMVWRFNLSLNKWILTKFVSPVILEENKPIAGEYTKEYPPKISVLIPVDAAKKVNPKLVKVVNNSNTLRFGVSDSKNNRVVSGLRGSPEIYGLFSGIRGSEYRVEIEPDVNFSEEVVNDFEVTLKSAEIKDRPDFTYKYGGIRGMDVEGKYVYAVGSRGLEILEVVGDKLELKSRNVLFGLATGIRVRNGIAYISNGPFGLSIVDVTNPEEPKVIGEELLIGISWDVEVVGGYAYVSTGVFGVQVVNINDIANPRWEDVIFLKGIGRGIRYYENKLIVENVNDKALIVVDLESKKEIKRIKVNEKIEGMEVVGDEMHIDTKRDGLIVYDLINLLEKERYEGGMGLLFGRYAGKKFIKVDERKGIEVYGIRE
jgi:hypothetical protein